MNLLRWLGKIKNIGCYGRSSMTLCRSIQACRQHRAWPALVSLFFRPRDLAFLLASILVSSDRCMGRKSAAGSMNWLLAENRANKSLLLHQTLIFSTMSGGPRGPFLPFLRGRNWQPQPAAFPAAFFPKLDNATRDRLQHCPIESPFPCLPSAMQRGKNWGIKSEESQEHERTCASPKPR